MELFNQNIEEWLVLQIIVNIVKLELKLIWSLYLFRMLSIDGNNLY